jgi:ribosomal protein L11 methyltransferase
MTASRRSWATLSLSVPEDLADEVAGAVGRGSIGVEFDPLGSGRVRVRLCFPSGADLDSEKTRITRALRDGWALGGESLDLAVETIEDEAWVERYQASLRPFPLGRGFVVVPGDETGDTAGRRPIRLVPGRAFGTGEHPTTRLCATALENEVRPGTRWLDLGTGTGILAVVAAWSGAGEVVAVDSDPEAVSVAREVAAANAGLDRVRFRIGSIDPAIDGTFDGVVVNISARYLRVAAAALAASVRAGGIVLISGFQSEDLEEVGSAMKGAGLEPRSTATEDDWVLLVLEPVSGVRR